MGREKSDEEKLREEVEEIVAKGDIDWEADD